LANNIVNETELDELVKSLFKDKENIIPKEFDELSEKQKEDSEITFFAIKKVISELLERQNLDVSEVSCIGSGYYSDTIKVGEFVVKVGFPRENRGVPYSKHIIQPLISYKVKMGVNIEVQNLVDAKWWEIKDENGNIVRELTEEEINDELFKVYADLRKDGIVWKDIKKENVGRLLIRNSSNFDIEYIGKNGEKGTYEMNLPDDRLDIVGRKEGENEILSAGELVIIDRDYLVGKGAWVVRNPTAEIGEKFNKRYEAMDR
jgi:hypothetical protein